MRRRWLSAFALLAVALSEVPLSMAVEEPPTEGTEQHDPEIANTQQEPKTTPEPETKRDRKRAKRQQEKERKEEEKALKKEHKGAKRSLKAKQQNPNELKARIARATNPAMPDKVRHVAILRLAGANAPEAHSALLQIARNREEKIHIRAWAIESLGRRKNNEGLAQPLLEILRDPGEPPFVRAGAAAALGGLKDSSVVSALLAASEDKAPAVRVNAVLALRSHGIDQVRLLGQLLNDEELSGETRALAAKLLGWTGDPKAADPLIQALASRPKSAPPLPSQGSVTPPASDVEADKPPVSPAVSASTTKEMATWDALSIAEETRQNFRMFSVLALGRLKEKRAIPILLELLKGDPDPAVRKESANTLLNLAGPKAEEAFIAAVSDHDPGVRLAAVVALKQVGGPKVVTPLIETLKDSNHRVRLQAVEVLGKLGPGVASKAIEPLRGMVEQEKIAYVKQAAQAALAKLLPPAPPKSGPEAGS